MILSSQLCTVRNALKNADIKHIILLRIRQVKVFTCFVVVDARSQCYDRAFATYMMTLVSSLFPLTSTKRQLSKDLQILLAIHLH